MGKNPFRCSEKKKLRMNRNPKKRLGSSHDPSLHLFFSPKMAMTCFEVCRSTKVPDPKKRGKQQPFPEPFGWQPAHLSNFLRPQMEVSNKNGGGRQTEKSFKAAQRADLVLSKSTNGCWVSKFTWSLIHFRILQLTIPAKFTKRNHWLSKEHGVRKHKKRSSPLQHLLLIFQTYQNKMPKAQNFSWESTSAPSLFKALSKRPYFSFRGKQPAIDSLMLGNPTSCEDHLNRPNHLDRSAILEFGPPSPFSWLGKSSLLEFLLQLIFVGVFKVFVAFHSENINFMHCNAQEGVFPVFRITQFLQILLWVIRFWSEKKGVETKGREPYGCQLSNLLHSCMWGPVLCESKDLWCGKISLAPRKIEPPCHPVAKKNTHQNRRSQTYNH